MVDFVVLNIREYLNSNDNKFGENELQDVLSEFSCPINHDVEKFLKEQSIEFTKKNQSVTYLVFTKEDGIFVGYFSLTIKPINIKADKFSNTTKRKLSRISKVDIENGIFSLPAYLIAQLSKNYYNSANKMITGEQLLQLAITTIKELQYMIGGMVIFLEAENKQKLIDFYEQNSFKQFDTKEITVSNSKKKLIQFLKVL